MFGTVYPTRKLSVNTEGNQVQCSLSIAGWHRIFGWGWRAGSLFLTFYAVHVQLFFPLFTNQQGGEGLRSPTSEGLFPQAEVVVNALK